MIRPSVALLFFAVAPLAAADTIYKCVDENGGTLISNTRIDKSCKAVVSAPDSSIPAPRSRNVVAAAPAVATGPTPASFPRVAEDTQRARDGDRRRILEQELTAEQKGLDGARRDLAEQEAVRGTERNSPAALDRLAPYKDRVALHERNIQAINRELANLK